MTFHIIISISLLYLVNKIFNLRNIFNPFVFVVLIHFFFFYLGLIYKDIYTHIIITNETTLIINYSFISVIIGGIVSRYFFQRLKNPYLRFPYMQKVLPVKSKTVIVGYLFIFIGFLCTLKFIYNAGGLVIFMEDIENTRIEARKGQGLITQLAILFFTYGLLTLIMSKFSNSIKLILTVIVLFWILSFGNRGPALYLLVFVIFVMQSVNNVQFTYKKILVFGLFLFSVMVLLGAIRTNGAANLYDLFIARFAWRPFVNIQNFQYVVNYFPNKHEFLLGQTYWVDFSMLFPGSHPNSGTFLKELMGWRFDGGSVTPSFLGISYINFGYYGLIFSPFLLGFISNSVYEIYSRSFNLNNPLNLILLLILSFNFASIVPSGVMTVLIQNISVVLIVHVLYFMITKINLAKIIR
tara:strand:+ start:32121 stop:33350 length:1230 start_codon:yes stop_codon:yes gene_type:complete